MTPRRRRYDVAFYAPALGPLLSDDPRAAAGGAETQVLLLARALARRGVRVALVVFEVPGVDLPPRVDGVDVVVRREYRRGRGIAARLREALAVRSAVASVDADVFVARAAGPAAGIVALHARTSGRRFVYASSSDADFGRLETRLANRGLVRLALRLADLVVVQNEFQCGVCARLTARPIRVIRSVAESRDERSAAPSAFLWVGRAISYKRPLACVELARALPEASFVMVVPSLATRPDLDLSGEVVAAARDLPNLRVLPAQTRKEISDLVEHAVAVVNTSEFEGMPNAFLEGWARGVPALALSHDPDGVIERHALGAFARGSFDEFVAAARRLWNDRFDQDELARRCRRYANEAHSAEVISAEWIAALGLEPAATERAALAEVA